MTLRALFQPPPTSRRVSEVWLRGQISNLAGHQTILFDNVKCILVCHPPSKTQSVFAHQPDKYVRAEFLNAVHMLFEEVEFHAGISLGRWIRFQAFPCHPTNGSCTNAHATETHAGMMAQAGAVSPKMIAHFPKLLGVFVDRRWAKVFERTSKSVLHDGPHAHRGMRHGHTNIQVH